LAIFDCRLPIADFEGEQNRKSKSKIENSWFPGGEGCGLGGA
jgi:hypothetical protein